MSGSNRGGPGLWQYNAANPADWPVLPRTVQEALDLLADGGSAGSGSAGIIYRPGGVTVGNVLATAAEVKQAIADLGGAVKVFVDASVAPVPGTATWPDAGTGASIGVTDCLGTVEFLAYGNDGVNSPGPGGPTTLKVLDGASFKNLRKIGTGILFAGVCTTTSALSFSNDSVLTVESESIVPATLIEVLAGATVPLISIPAGVSLLLYTQGGVEVQNLAGGAVPVIGLPTATSSLTWFAAGGLSVPAGPTVTGIAGSTLTFVALDAQTQVPGTTTAWPSPGFAGTLTIGLGYVAPTFYYAPGSVSGSANVFTSGEQLRQAVNSVLGPKTIFLDTTGGATHLTAGTWNLDMATIVSPTGAAGVLTVDTGVTLTPWRVLKLENVSFQNAAGATTPVTVPTGKTCTTVCAGTTGGLFCAAGASPLVEVQSGGNFNVEFHGNMTVGNTGAVVLLADVGGTYSLRFYDASVLAATVLTGGGTFNVRYSDAATISATQGGVTGTLAITAQSVSGGVSYTPTTPGNWQPAPTSVLGGLDQLAAPNPTSQAGNTGTGTGTVTVTTGNIAKKRSGLVMIVATITGSIAASAAVTAQLVRDAATNIGSPSSCTPLSAADVFSLTCVFIDTLPDAANHTYKLSTTSAQNLTVAATSTQISAVEL
jgi:hypothetical protein